METTELASDVEAVTAEAVMDSHPELPPDLRLHWLLQRAGYKEIQELARELKLDPSTVSHILNGRRYERALTTLKKMADTLGLTLDQLANLISDMRAKGRYPAYLTSWERLALSALQPSPDRTIDLTETG